MHISALFNIGVAMQPTSHYVTRTGATVAGRVWQCIVIFHVVTAAVRVTMVTVTCDTVTVTVLLELETLFC